MPENGRGQPVVVDVGGCRCPGAPHASDWVELAPKLTVPMGAAVMNAIQNTERNEAALEAAIVAVFLRQGIVAWSFTDEEGEPVPIRSEEIDRLLDWATAHDVAERADALYAQDLFRPFAASLSTLSPPTPTGGLTSARNGSGSKRPKHSKRSSPPVMASKPSEDPAR